MKSYLCIFSKQLNKDHWEYDHINEPARITYESLSNSLQMEVKPDHLSHCMLGKAAFPYIIKGGEGVIKKQLARHISKKDALLLIPLVICSP